MPRVGSEAWYEGLAEIGTGRQELDERWARVLGGRNASQIDPHRVRLGSGSRALHAAFWTRFHHEAPGYAAMMYLRHVFINDRRVEPARPRVAAWIVRQLAAMLAHGPDEVRKSALYGLSVDYFEEPSDAKYVFTRLVPQLPRASWGALLPATALVAWRDKATFYRACAGASRLHKPLVEALESSVYGLWGQVDMRALGRLAEEVPAVARSERLRVALSGPSEVWVGEVRVAPRRAPPPWRDGFLIGVRALTTLPSGIGVKPGSELVIGGEVVGVVRRLVVSDDSDINWRRLVAPELDNKAELVSMQLEGPKRALPRLVGRKAEIFLPGLRAYLRERRPTKAARLPTGASVATKRTA